MKAELISEKLQQNKSVYIKDDFEQMAIRIVPEAETLVFAKFKGKKEYPINQAVKIVFDIQMNGEEISKSEYENY